MAQQKNEKKVTRSRNGSRSPQVLIQQQIDLAEIQRRLDVKNGSGDQSGIVVNNIIGGACRFAIDVKDNPTRNSLQRRSSNVQQPIHQ